jgi:protein-tyrosine phosphatase
MKHVYWVVPEKLAGRPGPQEVPWNLQELWDGGFRTIVSLSRIDGQPIRAAGFRHHSVPLNGGLAFFPLLRNLLVRRMIPVIDFIAEEVTAGRPTLVHCRQGRDRTGAVLAGYMIRHGGLSPEEALRALRSLNPQAMVSTGFDRLPRLLLPKSARGAQDE